MTSQVLDKGELAPGLHYTELQQRRQNLAHLMPAGSLAVIPAASLAFVTGVIPYPYRQDADFLYLTGMQQQAVALIRTGGEWCVAAPGCMLRLSKHHGKQPDAHGVRQLCTLQSAPVSHSVA